MQIIDTHQHFWQYNHTEYPWIQPERTALAQDHMPEQAETLMQHAGVTHCIAVEARNSDQENQFLLELAHNSEMICGVVGRLDVRFQPDRERLRTYAENPLFCGIRQSIQFETQNPIVFDSDYIEGINLLTELGLTHDLHARPADMAALYTLIRQCPNQTFIINHIGKPDIKSGELDFWKQGIQKLAQLPNAFCKVSGMITEADRDLWQPGDFTPYFDIVFEAFTPNRLMYGSDWPVSGLAATYQQTVEVVQHYANQLSETEQAQLFHKTAQEVYQFPTP